MREEGQDLVEYALLAAPSIVSMSLSRLSTDDWSVGSHQQRDLDRELNATRSGGPSGPAAQRPPVGAVTECWHRPASRDAVLGDGGVSWLEGILLGIVATAAVIDFRTRRIPNWLTLSAVLLGLVLQTLLRGLPGLLTGFLGLLVGAGLFFIPFALGGMGPGDVKLMAAVGAFLGPPGALWAALMTGVAGGVLALVWAALHGRLARAFQRTGSWPARRWISLPAARGGMPPLEKDAN